VASEAIASRAKIRFISSSGVQKVRFIRRSRSCYFTGYWLNYLLLNSNCNGCMLAASILAVNELFTL